MNEDAIWEAVRTLPVPFPVPIKFVPSGITRWLCPPGNAEVCHWLSENGVCLTVRPKTKHYALYEGLGDNPQPEVICTNNGIRLWYQEELVYRLEMRAAMRNAVEMMYKLFPFPRAKGHLTHDIDHYPEDFGWEYKTKQIMILAIENWIATLNV